MKIYFGLGLDDSPLPVPEYHEGNIQYLGPQGFLYVMESHLGLAGHANDNEFLRIEQFRQAIIWYLNQWPKPFFRASFDADQFATATELLNRRDELLLANWSFQEEPNMPERLRFFCRIEAALKDADKEVIFIDAGYADRFNALFEQVNQVEHPIKQISCNTPEHLLPQHYQRFFRLLQDQKVTLEYTTSNQEWSENDLGQFQRWLQKEGTSSEKLELAGDGSLIILQGKRETDLASYLAKIFRLNTTLQPACLIPNKNRALDNAIIQEGLPSMGILSASLARPTLQVLKLITVFLWNPIDPFKILEFVSLAVKPLEDGLAKTIAQLISQTPGLNGESWNINISRYFERLSERAQQDSSIDVKKVREQFNYLFERRRYDASGTVPKKEAIELFFRLQQWAYQAYDESGNTNQSLFVLSEQAKRIKELLETLPEDQLTHLQLERVVRTIYEPAPVEFKLREEGHYSYTHHPAAFVGTVDKLVWWNFIDQEKDHFFSRWYQKERTFLTKRQVILETPLEENNRLLWCRNQPIFNTQNQLILVVPERIDGSIVHPHPLMSDLEAGFKSLESIRVNIDNQAGERWLEQYYSIPKQYKIRTLQLGKPKPFIYTSSLQKIAEREHETFSSLENLLYYPYQWVFRHKIRLRASSILSVVKDHTLMGNLAHRFFEKLLARDVSNWNKEQVDQWIDREAPKLFNQEGAVLLMYGREPERINFIQRIKYAAWSLINILNQNGWKVHGSEQDLEANFLERPIKGRADLVLQNEEDWAIIDLKWRGASRRERLIRNEEDLQLVLYSKLLNRDESWAHTAYFIMERGKMIARNNRAFKNIQTVLEDADHEEVNQQILDRMEATFAWRLEQIQQGQIEIRCQATQKELEEIYAEQLLDLLEMKRDDAPFDDYRTLINLVQ